MREFTMPDRKGVYIFFSGDFPEGNSKNARLKAIGTSLAQQGFRVRFASVFPSVFSEDRHEYTRSSSWEGIKFIYLSGDSRYYKFKLLRLAQIVFGQIMAMVYAVFNYRNIDIAYFYSPKLIDTLIPMLFMKAIGKTIVIDHTELFSSLGSGVRLHRWEETRIAKNADLLLLISDKLYSYFQSRYPNTNIYKFPIMVDLDRFQDLQNEETKYLVGYIGSYAEKDGVEMMISAVKVLRKEFPELRLKLMGFNPNKKQLDEYITEMEMDNHVIRTGKLSYSGIPYELNECDTLIINRTSDEFSTYGFPIKLGEYFAAEKTVLISDIGGYADSFQNGRELYKYESNSEEALIDAIRNRYAHMQESEAVAIRGRHYAEDHFDVRKNSLLLKNLIRDLKR